MKIRIFPLMFLKMSGVLGLTVLGLGVSFGFNCGYPLNPARDLAPRLFMGNFLQHSCNGDLRRF